MGCQSCQSLASFSITAISKQGYLGAEKREVGGSVHRSGVALDKAAGTKWAVVIPCNGAPPDNETRGFGRPNLFNPKKSFVRLSPKWGTTFYSITYIWEGTSNAITYNLPVLEDLCRINQGAWGFEGWEPIGLLLSWGHRPKMLKADDAFTLMLCVFQTTCEESLCAAVESWWRSKEKQLRFKQLSNGGGEAGGGEGGGGD